MRIRRRTRSKVVDYDYDENDDDDYEDDDAEESSRDPAYDDGTVSGGVGSAAESATVSAPNGVDESKLVGYDVELRTIPLPDIEAPNTSQVDRDADSLLKRHLLHTVVMNATLATKRAKIDDLYWDAGVQSLMAPAGVDGEVSTFGVIADVIDEAVEFMKDLNQADISEFKREDITPSDFEEGVARIAHHYLRASNGPAFGNCARCLQAESREKQMLHCTLCRTSFHARCCGLSETVVAGIRTQGTWCCPLCKVCERCRDGAATSKLLLCDGCDSAFHLSCLIPPLPSVPKLGFRCGPCNSKKQLPI